MHKSGNDKWKTVWTAKNSKNGFEERERKKEEEKEKETESMRRKG